MISLLERLILSRCFFAHSIFTYFDINKRSIFCRTDFASSCWMRHKGAVHAPFLKSSYPRRPTREIKTSGLCIIEWNPRSLSWKHILQSTRAYIIELELIKINLFIPGQRQVATRWSEKRKRRGPRVFPDRPALLNSHKLKADSCSRAGSIENDATLVNRPQY